MTELFLERDVVGPATHVLVIGVGGYPHLKDGTGKPVERLRDFGNLGQLTSPPRSALALASWLRNGSDPDRWKAPLATVDVLISPAPSDPEPGGPGVNFRDASIDNIHLAFKDWADRCETNPNNIAIFYFCGHGLQSDQQLLLASDFGRLDNPYRGAFAFDDTRAGFAQRLPRTQCFLIDACRAVPIGVLAPLGGATADPLVTTDGLGGPVQCVYDLTLPSVAPFERAAGRPGEVSYFTQALLRAFQGGAATTDDYGEWVVTNETVARSMRTLLSEVGASHQLPTPGIGHPTVLYKLDGVPDVKLTLECDPRLALAKAKLSCEPIPPGPPGRMERIPPVPTPWQLTVKAGHYLIGATFVDNSFTTQPRPVFVEPPACSKGLRVTAP